MLMNWEHIATQTNHVLIITDCNHKIVWVNESFMQLSGMASTEAVGLDICAHHAASLGNAKTLTKMNEAKQKCLAFRGELQIQNAANQPVWLDVEISPLFDQAGIVVFENLPSTLPHFA